MAVGIERTFRNAGAETDWIRRGACVGMDPELFFPVGTTGPAVEQTRRAVSVCMGCAVRSECLAWALDTSQDAGVWGGLDEESRREIRRARRRAAAGRQRELTTIAG